MDEQPANSTEPSVPSTRSVIARLRKALSGGRPWASALVEAVGLWPLPQETYRGRRLTYLIAGEAFDWLLLADRLCKTVRGLVPEDEKEALLFSGRLPPSFNPSSFGDLLGGEKYRAYLNFHYGVTVEEALQLAAELEVLKRHTSNGVGYRDDHGDEAFAKVYGSPRAKLLEVFRSEVDSPSRPSLSLAESKEFTYWLFKYRLHNSDKARIASDTRKGLQQLHRMRDASGGSLGPVDVRVLDVDALDRIARKPYRFNAGASPDRRTRQPD